MISPKTLLSCLLICIVVTTSGVRASEAATAKGKYIYAESCYKKLRHNPGQQKYRRNWLTCINKFQAVYMHDPSGPWAAAGLYQTGILYYELSKRSYRISDKQEAMDIFRRIIKRYPKSRYRYRAEEDLKSIAASNGAQNEPHAVEHKKRDSRFGKKTTAALPNYNPHVEKKSSNGQINNSSSAYEKKSHDATGNVGNQDSVKVTGLRFWSNPDYTRIVIDADHETAYNHHLLKKDPSIHKPQRLYVDLKGSRLGKDIPTHIPINDDLLKNARAGQYTPDAVRVVIDIKSFKDYKIFSLKNPFRIVIDVWGTSDSRVCTVAPPSNPASIPKNVKSGALAKQLALCVNRIVIDPGHGGHDYGAPGYLKGVHEKDITLKIAKKLAAQIRKQLKCEVILTRKDDRFLTLEERTAIANTKNADLFISIHANAARDKDAFGIETYFLNLATDDDAISVAARENATSTKNISDLQSILNDLMKNAKINESSRLAGHVQHSMYRHLDKRYEKINNKGVKQAPFYVLLGARMPAILVETSFISNPRECKRLMSSKYQEELCRSIVNGISQYVTELNPMAHKNRNQTQKPLAKL